jgi:uncharacterized protein YbjT (DUF2867 family)
VRALLNKGEAVTAVTRNRKHAERLERAGAMIAVADVYDVDAMRAIFRTGQRAFLLNPPAAVSGDTDIEERRTVCAILQAVQGSGLEKVVLESTYGAQPGERCGDLSVLFEAEEALRAQPIPVAINRAAYYLSNWAPQLNAIRKHGVLQAFFPEDFVLPMVAPEDLGAAAAARLTEPAEATGVHYVEGPRRYSARDVAEVFANALSQPVKVEVVPREKWAAAFRSLGFSEPAAHSFARMTAATLDEDTKLPAQPERGTVTLENYVNQLLSRRAPKNGE